MDDHKGQVKVLFVDYGTVDWIDRRDIRLRIMLKLVPIQAIRCRLQNDRFNIEVSSNGKPVGHTGLLHNVNSFMVDKEFRVSVKGIHSPLEVTLTE